MSLINSTRNGCKDVFKAFLVEKASYQGELEIPIIEPQEFDEPKKLILFSKSFRTDDYDQWICFYEDDSSFEKLWNNPRKYLDHLKRFKGVISPDFSLYRDMPLVMQQWNTYRGKAIGYWLQNNGIKVIPNIRWGDERTYPFCCLGVIKHSPIAIGSHGCAKINAEKKYLVEGLKLVVNELAPSTIIVYGPVIDEVKNLCISKNINILNYSSDWRNGREGEKV